MSRKEFKEFADFVAQQFSKIMETKVDKADVREIVEQVTEKQTGRIMAILDEQSKYFQEQT